MRGKSRGAQQPPTARGDLSSDRFQVQSISKSFGRGGSRVRALIDIDLDLPPRSFTAIMGPSGSGKSTLLNCILGLDKPDSGSIIVGDTHIETLDETRLAELRRSHFGVIFQSYNLLPALTVADNISLPIRLAGQPIDSRRVRELASVVGIESTLQSMPSELSGGQQQRVAVARSLTSNPQVIVADEPTGALDSQSGDQVLALLRQVADQFGQRVLMVTHDARAASVADRVLIMSDGRWADDLRGASVDRIVAAVTASRQRP